MSSWILNAMVCVMGMCLAVPSAELAGRILPGGYTQVLPILCLVVCVESIYSRLSLGNLEPTSREWWRFRVGEWVMLLLAVKFTIFLFDPTRDVAGEIDLWLRNPIVFFWDPPFFISLIVVGFVWQLASTFSADLRDLRALDAESIELEHTTGIRRGLGDLRRAFIGHMVFFGVVTAFVVGAGQATNARSQTGGGFLLLYFVLGLILMGLTQYNAVSSNWLREHTPAQPNIGAHWAGYAALLMLVLIGIAVLAPTGFVNTLLSTFGRVLGLGIYALIMLVYGVMQLFGLIYFGIMYLISRLLGLQPPELQSRPPPSPPPFLGDGQDQPSLLFLILQSALFWGIILALVGYSLYFFFGRRAGYRGPLRGVRDMFAGLAAVVRALLQGLHTNGLRPLAQFIRAQIDRATGRTGRAAGPTWLTGLRADLRNMSPRERVRFYYRAMLERNARAGLPRKPAQTPEEYADVLDSAAPAATDDVSELTRLFTEARYTAHDVSDEHVGIVRRSIARIRAALKPPR